MTEKDAEKIKEDIRLLHAEIKKAWTCSFSGHREIPQQQILAVKKQLREQIINAIKDEYLWFCCGGALGFDTLAAQTVLELKEQYPDILLMLALPCKTQTSHWKQADIDEYERIKSLADEIIYTSEEYEQGCMQKRNRFMVDNSSMLICYLTKNSGGTAYTVDYANSKNKRIINIAQKLSTDYFVTAKAEVLSEKAHGILAKYAKYTNYNAENTPEAIIDIENKVALLAKEIIQCKTEEEINKAAQSLAIYENIIDNIQAFSDKNIDV